MDFAGIQPDMTIFELTERFPQTIRVLVESGFPKMSDPDKRRGQGQSLTIRAAAQLKQLDAQELVAKLAAAVQADASQTDVTLAESSQMTLLPPGDVRVSGLLPCPVRLPILEAVRALAARLKRERGLILGWSLSAASVGADGLNQEIARVEEEKDLPEVFISAGFESFFDRVNLRRFKERGTFVDVAPWPPNPCFAGLDLRDPGGHFTLLGVVPAVFLVNQNLLQGDPAPRTWEDVLHPRFTRRVALPVGDFDLFNGILLNLHRLFGDEGLAALARNMLVSLHPSQTVGRFSGRAAEQPAVSIIPYFFSKMTMNSQVIRTVWPEDGAIISPIFMLVRKAALERSRELVDLFLSREVGEILARRGNFPVLHPEVENPVAPGARFHWIGWDFIEAHDFGPLIPELSARFKAYQAPATGDRP